jgi:hypothetical protein
LRKCAFSLDFYNPNFLLFEYWLRFGILKDHSLFMIGQAYTAVILRTEETGSWDKLLLRLRFQNFQSTVPFSFWKTSRKSFYSHLM